MKNPSGLSVKAERLSGPHGRGQGAGLGGRGGGVDFESRWTCSTQSSRSYTKGLLSAIIVIIIVIIIVVFIIVIIVIVIVVLTQSRSRSLMNVTFKL